MASEIGPGPETFEVVAKAVGVLISVAAAIGISWRGRTKWEPPEEELPGAVEQLSKLLTAVSLALILTQMTDAAHSHQVTTLTITSAVGCLLAFSFYAYLIGMHTYALQDRRVIGGFLLNGPIPSDKTLREYLSDVGDPDKVWTPRSRVVMKLCFAFAYLLLTVLGSVTLVGAVVMRPHPSIVQIASPAENAIVEHTQKMTGTAKNLVDNSALWIVVYPWDTQMYCPQAPVEVLADGSWSALVPIGVDRDEGKKFDVMAVVVQTPEAKMFEQYLEKQRISETHPGTQLPKNARIFGRITVERR